MDSPAPDQVQEVVGHVAAVPASVAPLSVRFRTLFDAELPYVWTSLGRLGIPDRDREDLANEVFYRVHQRFEEYDPERPIRPWLFAFAVRVASEHRRLARNRFERVGGDEDAASRASAAPDGPLEARDLVERGLSGLDIDKRAVFVMHHLDEQTIPDVARALGIPEGTAYSRLRAAREAFTATIRRIQRGEP